MSTRAPESDVVFEFGGLAMRFAEARALVHFEMQLDEQAAIEVMRGQFVDGEAAALGDGADGLE